MVVINVVIGGFSGEDLNWLAHITDRLQPTVRLQLCRLLGQTTAVYVPITLAEIVIAVIHLIEEQFGIYALRHNIYSF